MRVAAVSVLATLAILSTSCGTEGNDADDPAAVSDRAAEEPAQTEEPADGQPADGEAVVEADPSDAEPAAEVEIKGFSFQPAAIEVQVGDTVRWTNGDATRHTVTAGVDGEPTDVFHLTFAEMGDSGALTFDEPGEYPYFCTPHPFMQGTVTVSG